MAVDPARMKEIFAEALTKGDAAVRAAYLNEACAGDAALLERIEALLAAHAAESNFIKLPGGDQADNSGFTISEGPGTKIGRYKLLQEIGEGGMGVVYMAEQTEPVERKVAPEDHQAGHGHAPGDRALRSRAAGPGADGPSQHCQDARRGHDRKRPPLLRDGVGQGHPDHQVLRRASSHAAPAAGTVHSRLPGRAACATKKASSTAI